VAPLRAAPDAVPLDTTGLSLAEQVRRVVTLVRAASGASLDQSQGPG
jgi:cytidylate kinase